MAMRPDGMERWGVVAILKESARLLHKHYRLFLPFLLAFYLPSSFAGIFQILFLQPSATPLHFASFIKTTAFTGHTDTANPLVPAIISATFSLLILVLGTLALGAVTYIVAYIYSNADIDTTIVKKVFKLLPHAFLRMFVTNLWTILVIFVLHVFSFLVGGILYAIISAITGRSDPILVVLLALLPFLVGTIFVSVVFAFSQFIAVLEPENYGREALKRSTKLARSGRAGTIVAVLFLSILFSGIFVLAPTQAIANGTLPLWENIVLGIFLAVVDSVLSAYVGVVSVVMYFVYKSKFDAVNSSIIPEFQRASSAENPYKPLVPGNAYPSTVGEP